MFDKSFDMEVLVEYLVQFSLAVKGVPEGSPGGRPEQIASNPLEPGTDGGGAAAGRLTRHVLGARAPQMQPRRAIPTGRCSTGLQPNGGPLPHTGVVKAASTDRKPSQGRSEHADPRGERLPRQRRSGEGAESALASLKSIELDRRKTRTPVDDSSRD